MIKKIKRLVKYCGSPKKIKTKKGHIEFIHSIKFIKNQNDLVIVPYNQTIHHDYKLDEILDDTVKQIIPFKLTDDMLHIYTFNEGNNKLNEISDPKQEKIFSPIKLEKKEEDFIKDKAIQMSGKIEMIEYKSCSMFKSSKKVLFIISIIIVLIISGIVGYRFIA